MARNVALIPWYGFLRNLLFWQATWFLFFQNELSAAEAILLYAVFDVTTTALEVPSGWMSDRVGRRVTLIAAALAGATGAILLAIGGGFAVFAAAQMFWGAHAALVSGTDSAILFESLAAEGRKDEVEIQEVRHWRFTFIALALSAFSGGLLAQFSPVLPFIATALAMVGLIVLSLAFTEPQRERKARDPLRLETLWPAFRNPVLLWLFALGVLMYGFSHIPFVFGQPFILEALSNIGWDAEVPLISGAVSTIMMLISLGVSLYAPTLRHLLGLGPLLLLAFGMQVGLAAVLSLTNAPLAILLLFLRMVPSSLSGPFMLARIQPLLEGDTRATYLSLRSFLGRLLFALSLFVAAGSASDVGSMDFGEISTILTWYAFIGVAAWITLLLCLRRVAIDPVDEGERA